MTASGEGPRKKYRSTRPPITLGAKQKGWEEGGRKGEGVGAEYMPRVNRCWVDTTYYCCGSCHDDVCRPLQGSTAVPQLLLLRCIDHSPERGASSISVEHR